MDARLSITDCTGRTGIVAAIHGIRTWANLNFEFFGHKFTDEDKKPASKRGIWGVWLIWKSQTGEFDAVNYQRGQAYQWTDSSEDRICQNPDELKRKIVNDEQNKPDGNLCLFEGMISKKGLSLMQCYSLMRIKRFVEFLFDRNNNKSTISKKTVISKQSAKPTQEARELFRGKGNLDDEQYNKFKGRSNFIYIDGLKTKRTKISERVTSRSTKKLAKQISLSKIPNKLKRAGKTYRNPQNTNWRLILRENQRSKTKKTKNLWKGQQRPKMKNSRNNKEKPKPAKSKGVKR